MVFGIRDSDDFSRRRGGGFGRFVGREHNQQHDITDPNTGEASVDIFDSSGVPSGNVIEIDDTSGNPEKRTLFRSSGKEKDTLDASQSTSNSNTTEDEIPLEDAPLQPDEPQQGKKTGQIPVRDRTDITFGGRTGISSEGEKSSVSNNILSRFFSGQLTGIEAPSVSRSSNIDVGNALSVGNVSRNISILQNPFGMMQSPYPDAKMPRATEPTAQGAKSPSAADTLKSLLAKNKSTAKTTAQPSQIQKTEQRPLSSKRAIGQLSPIDVLRAMSKAKEKGKPAVNPPKPSAKTDVKTKVKPELKNPDPKDLRGYVVVGQEPTSGKRGRIPLNMPLYTFGHTPELGLPTPAYLTNAVPKKDANGILLEKHPDLVKIEEAHVKKAIKLDPIAPIDYQGRINEFKDPELDPLSPNYNFGKFFNNYILGLRLTRLSDKHNWEAGYPYDIRRSILRNPLTDPNIIVWQNGAGIQKLDPKLVLEFKRNLEEIAIKPYALRDAIYVPNEEDELMKDDTKQVFDLMHLSENLLSHHYSDLDKHREYLESGKPMDSNFREMLSKVEGMLKKKLPAPALSVNPLDMNKKFKALKDGVVMPALDPKREVFEKFQKMLWSQNVGSKNNPEFNMLHAKFSPKKDLAKVLLKTQPRTETAPFDVLSQELAETNHFMGSFMGKDDFGDRMLSDMLGRPTKESDLHESMGESWISGMLDQTSPLYNRGRKKKATQSSYNILTGEREFI